MNLVTEPAWSDFCDRLTAIGLQISDEESPRSPLDRIDGLRHIGMLTEAALRWHLRYADPDYPRFCELNDTPEIADNLFAAVRGDADYVIRGSIATLFDVNISIHDGWPFLGNRGVWGDLGRAGLDVDCDDRFELVLSAQPHDGNWLRLPPEAAIVQIRQYYADWENDAPGSFEIERIGSTGGAPGRLQPADLARRLDATATWIEGYLASHRDLVVHRFPATPNTITAPSAQPGRGGNSNIWYGPGRFRFQPHEALVIEFRPPRARMWSLQWLLDPWYENADMANCITSLSSGDATVDSDGQIRIVVAGSEPGVPNWLDTTGYGEGLLMLRWLWCDEGSEPVATAVPLDRLRSYLPHDTPTVGVEQRAAQIARRRSCFARRGR